MATNKTDSKVIFTGKEGWVVLHRQVVQNCHAKAPKEVLQGKASHKEYVHSENMLGIQSRGRDVPPYMLAWEEVTLANNWLDLEKDIVLDYLLDNRPTYVWSMAKLLKEDTSVTETEQGGDEDGTTTPKPEDKPGQNMTLEQKEAKTAGHESTVEEEEETTDLSSGYASIDRRKPSLRG